MLQADGATWNGAIAAGFDITLASTLLNAGVVVPYTSGDTLDASVWRGGSESALFSPAVAWVDATAGTFTLTVGRGQTATLDAGAYRLQVGVTSGGSRSLVYDATIEITEAPGSDSPPIAWCTDADMATYSHVLRSLQSSRGSNLTGFLVQRAVVTAKYSREIVTRYRPRRPVKVRQPTLDPVLNSFDIPNPTAVAPSTTDLTNAVGQLGGIVLEEKLREIIARAAISIVLREQATNSNAGTYIEEAEMQQEMADALFKCYQAQIITAEPVGVGVSVVSDGQTFTAGFTRFLIDRDCVVLPEGTSP
jgi:hypothetical protein